MQASALLHSTRALANNMRKQHEAVLHQACNRASNWAFRGSHACAGTSVQVSTPSQRKSACANNTRKQNKMYCTRHATTHATKHLGAHAHARTHACKHPRSDKTHAHEPTTCASNTKPYYTKHAIEHATGHLGAHTHARAHACKHPRPPKEKAHLPTTRASNKKPYCTKHAIEHATGQFGAHTHAREDACNHPCSYTAHAHATTTRACKTNCTVPGMLLSIQLGSYGHTRMRGHTQGSIRALTKHTRMRQQQVQETQSRTAPSMLLSMQLGTLGHTRMRGGTRMQHIHALPSTCACLTTCASNTKPHCTKLANEHATGHLRAHARAGPHA
jgi:hypothetical protein